MSLLTRTASKAFTITRSPALQGNGDNLLAMVLGQRSKAGVNVTPEKAIGLVPVYSATHLIAQAIGSLPVRVTRVDAEGSKRPERPEAYRALWGRPNPWHSRPVVIESILASMLLWGNAYLGCVYDRIGVLIQLWPIDPSLVDVEADGDDRVWTVRGRGEYRSPANDPTPPILHIPALVLPGKIKGLSLIEAAMQSVGIAHAIELTTAGFYGNGMTPAGQIKTKATLSPNEARELAGRMRSAYGGPDKAGKWVVMDNDAEIAPIMIPPQQAQFVEQQRWSAQQCASLFRVPPHLIGDVQRSSSWGTGIEEQTIGFAIYTLTPWIKRIEMAIGDAFLASAGYELEIGLQGLLRGSTLQRYQAYAMALQNRFMSPNEARRLEGWPTYEGGDEFAGAANLYGDGQPGDGGPPPPPDREDDPED